MNEELLKAIESLIEKYSKDYFQGTGPDECALCKLYFEFDCCGCPNKYFTTGRFRLGCCVRGIDYSSLNFGRLTNYPTLKKFWIRYKELYLEGKENDVIMETLIQEFS